MDTPRGRFEPMPEIRGSSQGIISGWFFSHLLPATCGPILSSPEKFSPRVTIDHTPPVIECVKSTRLRRLLRNSYEGQEGFGGHANHKAPGTKHSGKAAPSTNHKAPT